MEKALISRVTYVKRSRITDYASKYYKNEDLIGFTALFPELNKKEQRKYLDKMYKSGRVAFFASVLKYLDDGLLSAYKEKASNDGKENFYKYKIHPHPQKKTTMAKFKLQRKIKRSK